MAKNIVIVEDDPDQRNNYIDAIGKKGYSVRGFSSRPEALAGFDEALPDLVILDIILGDEVDAGFELCRDLLSRAPNLPVIFLTERIAEIDKISGLRLGAWDYLPKPISLDYLSEKISSLLSQTHIDAINIPEVHDENERGERPVPNLERAEAREFGRLLQDRVGIEAIVNRVTVHDELEFQKKWILNS